MRDSPLQAFQSQHLFLSTFPPQFALDLESQEQTPVPIAEEYLLSFQPRDPTYIDRPPRPRLDTPAASIRWVHLTDTVYNLVLLLALPAYGLRLSLSLKLACWSRTSSMH